MNKTSRKLIQELVFGEIVKERLEQREKWGKGNRFNFDNFSRVLGEEFGEVCRAINEKDLENLREELIDVAATCVAYLEELTEEEYSKKDFKDE